MRTTLLIDVNLLKRAKDLTGIQEKSALVRAALEALIANETSKQEKGKREAGKRHAALAGSEPHLTDNPGRGSA
jgi:hypothetical protein